MQTEAEESIMMNGKLSLNPLTAQLHGALQDLHIPRFSPYYAGIITPMVMDGTLNLTADINYSRTNDLQIIRTDNITTLLDSIVINDKDNEKLLRDNIIITDDDLRLLAIEWANEVRSFLVQAGQVESERLFIIEPKTDKNESGSQRVEMIIK